MKSFSNETLNFFLQKVLFLLHFGSCQNCMSSANLVAENHQKLCNRRVLSTGEPCTCEYVTLFQSFHRGTLSIHWYIAQNFQPTFSMSVFLWTLNQDCHLQQILQSGYSNVKFYEQMADFCQSLVFQCSKRSSHQFEIMYLKLGNKKQNQRKTINENKI